MARCIAALAAMALALSTMAAAAKTYEVAWGEPAKPQMLTAHCGDSILFNWKTNGEHGVFLEPRKVEYPGGGERSAALASLLASSLTAIPLPAVQMCPMSTTPQGGEKQISPIVNDSTVTYTIPADYSGMLYFACQVPGACQKGMFTDVKVVCP